MVRNGVCAVTVTYHPDFESLDNLAQLCPQVEGLVVVDNGSSEETLALLRSASVQLKFTLIENRDNPGVGTALNQGIRWASARGGFRYVALFDQDSTVNSGFIDALISSIEPRLSAAKVGVVAPRICDRNTGGSDGPRRLRNGICIAAQTSGSLMPLNVFESEGWFNEELFIEFVDFEYCLRIVSAGWSIEFCDNATLLHSPGRSRRRSFLGVYVGTTQNQSPLRHYYSVRNGVWLIRQYWRLQPEWSISEALRLLKARIKAGVLETDKAAKLSLSLFGFRDAMLGKLGKRNLAGRIRITAQ